MPAGKQYDVLRPFRRTDNRTLSSASYKPGDVYTGPVEPGYLDPAGPDGRGALIADPVVEAAEAAAAKAAEEAAKSAKAAKVAEKTAPTPTPTPAPASDSSKEK